MSTHERDMPNVDSTCEYCGNAVTDGVGHVCGYFGPNLADTIRTLEAAVTALTTRVGELENPSPP